MGVETTKFIRKALYVDAVRVNANNFDDLVAWCSGEVEVDETPGSGTTKKFIKVRVHNPKNARQTKAFIGDWLLYTERGYKVYTNRAFRQAFDEVKDGVAVPQQVEAPKQPVRQEIPKFYFAPHSDELTETKPHKNAVPLTLDELMNIIRNELVGEELQNTTRPEPEPEKEPLPPQPQRVGSNIEIQDKRATKEVMENTLDDHPNGASTGADPEFEGVTTVGADPHHPDEPPMPDESVPQAQPGSNLMDAPPPGGDMFPPETPEMKEARETIEAEGGTVEPATPEAIAEVVDTPEARQDVIDNLEPPAEEEIAAEDEQIAEENIGAAADPEVVDEVPNSDIAVESSPSSPPVEPPKGIDTAGKRVLSENEQKVLGPDEVRKLILAGDVILAQDLEPAEQS